MVEIDALNVLVYLEDIYPCLLFILIKPTIYASLPFMQARGLYVHRNLMKTHSDTDWKLSIR